MDDIRLKYLSPIVTGKPQLGTAISPGKTQSESEGQSFESVLRDTLDRSSNVTFSKHAVKRAADHGIELSQERIARLNEGVRLAGEKNLDDTLILVDNTAFLVNVRNNTVITAVASSEMRGNVFTNINGTVII